MQRESHVTCVRAFGFLMLLAGAAPRRPRLGATLTRRGSQRNSVTAKALITTDRLDDAGRVTGCAYKGRR